MPLGDELDLVFEVLSLDGSVITRALVQEIAATMLERFYRDFQCDATARTWSPADWHLLEDQEQQGHAGDYTHEHLSKSTPGATKG
ncbi:hypothetical protein Q9189_005262 [Teloschistes chrysophthalmus]